MAKRKRLTPANPAYLDAPLETKAHFLGVADTGKSRTPPPVSQVAGDSAAVAALEEMSETLRRAREEGRMVLSLPLDAIKADHLVRDRLRADDEELDALCASIAARGQQTPIEVVALEGGTYGLISGWRRLTALGKLAETQPDGGFDTVLALLRTPADSAESYLAMIEENEIRVGLSYYERARIAARAVELGVFTSEKKALLRLYASASRAKRSKIRSFLTLVTHLDGVLRFPEAIPERFGLTLAARLEDDPRLGDRLVAALEAADPQDAEAEKSCLEKVLSARDKPASPPAPEPEELRDGVFLRQDGSGKLVLSGPGVTPDLVDKLRIFLSQTL
jgi:ParB-like chromosome segregation protein Spo0J